MAPHSSSNHAEDEDDAYKILGLEETCTDAEIKKSYRRLALLHHPDRGGDKHVFVRISNAYELLSDPRKRQEYDQSRRQPQYNHHPFEDFFGGSDRFHDPFEIFERVFRQEMGNMRSGGDPFFSSRRPGAGFMDDPFFSSGGGMFPGGMMPGMRMGRHSMFDQDPFFSNPMMGMMNGGASTVNYVSSTSMGGGGGGSVSTSTTTRMVNGQLETVTEKVIRHPDGRVERHVETSSNSNRNLPNTSQGESAHNRLTNDAAAKSSSRNRRTTSKAKQSLSPETASPAQLSGKTRQRKVSTGNSRTTSSGEHREKKTKRNEGNPLTQFCCFKNGT